jgi:phosphoglycerate dehydrogenase-like enzyme
MSARPKSIFLLRQNVLDKVYSETAYQKIAELTELSPVTLDIDSWRDSKALLAEVEYIFSSWGMPTLDQEFLDTTPKLKHIFYGAGSIRGFYTEIAQAKNIKVSSAWRANAVPTAEFAHAQIILSLKKFFRSQRERKIDRAWVKPQSAAGVFNSQVGLVGLGTVGQRVAAHLRDQHTLNIVAYDPFCTPQRAEQLKLQLVSLEELFASTDVISLHAPDLPTTNGMISRELLASMKPNATLINTARGKLIDEDALVEIMRERTDLDALLDVTASEPENTDSPLWDLPNVFITPHIAGSLNAECHRLGEYMVKELERLLSGEPLEHRVSKELLLSMA